MKEINSNTQPTKRSLSQKAQHSFESKFILYIKQVAPNWFK